MQIFVESIRGKKYIFRLLVIFKTYVNLFSCELEVIELKQNNDSF